MSLFKVFSLELIVFIVILATLLKVKRITKFTLKIAEGLNTFCPPSDKDFEMLEKTD